MDGQDCTGEGRLNSAGGNDEIEDKRTGMTILKMGAYI